MGAAVDAARSGRSAVLVVVGEPGIGKTVLLADAASYAAAAGLRVREARGVQAERDVPYAGLHALLGPLVTDGVLAGLPRLHAEALEVALGLRAGPGPTRLTIGAAVLGVLGAVEPVCLLVDDLQWLDPASVDALTFAARRLEPSRSPSSARSACRGRVLPARRRTAGPAARGARGRERTAPRGRGHRGRATPHRNGRQPAGDGRDRLGAQRRAGVRRRRPAARAAGQRPRGGVRRAARDPGSRRRRRRGCSPWPARPSASAGRRAVGIPLALDDLGRLGLTVPGRDVTWRHPLARSAAARGEPDAVRAAHTILAAAWATTRGGRDAPARAWHLAEAAQATDDEAGVAPGRGRGAVGGRRGQRGRRRCVGAGGRADHRPGDPSRAGREGGSRRPRRRRHPARGRAPGPRSASPGLGRGDRAAALAARTRPARARRPRRVSSASSCRRWTSAATRTCASGRRPRVCWPRCTPTGPTRRPGWPRWPARTTTRTTGRTGSWSRTPRARRTR